MWNGTDNAIVVCSSSWNQLNCGMACGVNRILSFPISIEIEKVKWARQTFSTVDDRPLQMRYDTRTRYGGNCRTKTKYKWIYFNFEATFKLATVDVLSLTLHGNSKIDGNVFAQLSHYNGVLFVLAVGGRKVHTMALFNNNEKIWKLLNATAICCP